MMRSAAYILFGIVLLDAAGCQGPQKPIFPAVEPPIVWPPAPDTPRIRYIGQIRGEADLDIRPTGLEALRAVVAGPRPTVSFSKPTAVAVADDVIFVADAGLGIVHRLDLDQRAYRLMRGNPNDPLQVPIDVTRVGADRIIVVDRGRAAVEVFNLAGDWQRTLTWSEIAAPTGAAYDAETGRLWIVDATEHACFAVSDLSEIVARLGKRGSFPGQFNYPCAAAAHPDVGLVVVDAMNFRVQVFEHSPLPTRAFGQKGDAAGDFSRPRDVALDSAGHIYVLDNQFENIQLFNRQGQLLMAFGRGGDGPGELAVPSGITIDDRDRIWVADSYNQRVQVFQYLAERAACAD